MVAMEQRKWRLILFLRFYMFLYMFVDIQALFLQGEWVEFFSFELGLREYGA